MYVDIVEIDCCNCGCTFWITKKHNARLLKTKEFFFCPGGHSQSYTGKSDNQKLLEITEEKRRLICDFDEALIEQDHLHKVINGYKGQLSKVKNSMVKK